MSGAEHPRERIFFVREPAQPEGIEPLRVLQRTDGKFIVYDERLALGRRTAALGDSLEHITFAARELVAKVIPIDTRRRAAPPAATTNDDRGEQGRKQAGGIT